MRYSGNGEKYRSREISDRTDLEEQVGDMRNAEVYGMEIYTYGYCILLRLFFFFSSFSGIQIVYVANGANHIF